MIDRETYEKEMAICGDFSKKGHCNWGKCSECGVIPLLHKMFTGEIIENKEELENLKKGLK